MTPSESAATIIDHIVEVEVENAALKGILGTLYTSPGHPLDWAAMLRPLRTDEAIRENVEAKYAELRRLLSDDTDHSQTVAARFVEKLAERLTD